MVSFSVLTPELIDEKGAREINVLLFQLSEELKKLSRREILKKVVNRHLVIIVAMEDEMIVGMASLYFVDILAHISARIEDVVVDKHYRRRGIAKGLLEELISITRNRNVAYIELTSRPARDAANQLYEEVGFKKISSATRGGTNLFRLNLEGST